MMPDLIRRSSSRTVAFRAALLVMFAALVCARMPAIVLHGRF